MFRLKQVPWTIVLSMSLVCGGFWIFKQQRKTAVATNSTLGVVATPQTVTVEGLPQGSAAKVQFTLKNVSQRTIRVQSVGTSCGCSVAEPMTDEIIRPGRTEFLFISATPPPFGNRNVQVALKLVDLEDASHEATIRLAMNLKGPPLAAKRVYELPTTVEMRATSVTETVRQFQFKTVEENSEGAWITGLSSTSSQINAEIVDCKSEVRPGGGIQRTYSCRLTAVVPQKADEILAGTIRLMSGASAADESAAFRVVVRRCVPLESFPSVLKIAANTSSETIRTVIVQAVEAESLRQLEISQKPEGISVEWLPDEERDVRKLLVRIPSGDHYSLTHSEPILLRDPQSRDSLAIQFICESE